MIGTYSRSRGTFNGFRSTQLISMQITQIRTYLQDRGMVYIYALFIAGYFLMPMAAGHRRLYYFVVLPAVLLLARELWRFYRHNTLALLLLTYIGYMLATLAWSPDFNLSGAGWQLWYALNVLSFVLISGYLWVAQAQWLDRLAHRSIWLAAAVAVASMVAWYLQHPFPTSRLEPLGVMHHQNKAACAYGLFLVLAMYYLFTGSGRHHKLIYLALSVILLSLIVFTQSRTALAAVGVGLLALLGYRAMGFLVAAAAGSWALLAANSALWHDRVSTLSFRPGIWRQVLNDMQDHWLFGHGYLADTTVQAYGRNFPHAHNSYLASLRDGGLFGLALLLALLLLAGLWAWRLHRRGERIYLALLLYGAVSITMDYDRLLVHPKELWLFFWLPIGLIMAVYPRRDDAQPLRYHGHQ